MAKSIEHHSTIIQQSFINPSTSLIFKAQFSSYVDLPRAAAANTPLSTSSPPPSAPCTAALLAARRGVFRPRLGDPTSAAMGPGHPEMAGSTMVQRKMMKNGV
jgi:hypothetical protein